MSSSFVKDCSDASAPASSNSMNSSGVNAVGSGAGNKTVFIIVNDSHIDQEQLSSILASHADASSEVSVLQMAGGGGGLRDVAASDAPDATSSQAVAAGTINSSASQQQTYHHSMNTIPLESGEASGGGGGYSELALDAESLHQLESVLCTDEARHLLASDNLLDILSAAPNTSGSSDNPASASSSTPTAGAGTVVRPAGRGRGRAPPKRRSQRQQDKAEREEVTKILAENQRMLQREREELMAAGCAGSQATDAQFEINNEEQERMSADDQHTEHDDSEEEEDDDDDDSSRDEEEQEDGDTGDDNDGETKEHHVKNTPSVAVRVAKTATRGRGRPRKHQSVALSGSGRGRGGPCADSGARGGLGPTKPGSLRGPRGRGRGRGLTRGNRGRHLPIMTREEEDDDDELPELESQSGAPIASSATREDVLDDLEKQLSDLHGEHEEEHEATPSPSPSVQAAGPPAPASKKIVFLKKGIIGMNKAASADKKKGAIKSAAQKKSEVKFQSKRESFKENENGSETEAKKDVNDEDEDGDDEDDEVDDDNEEEGDDSGDDDYDPVKESAIMNAVDDVSGNKNKSPKIASRRNSAKSVQEADKKTGDSPTKKAGPKKARGAKPEGSPKKTKHRLVDKKGNARYVSRKSLKSAKSQNSDKLPVVDKPKANPVETNYLKILQLAQKNVDEQTPKKTAKSLPDTKSVLKQMKEAMSENRVKSSIPGKEHQKDHKDGSSTKSTPPVAKSSDGSQASVPSLKSPKSLKPPITPTQKKPKLFTTALDVPYESLKKNKIVKKFATGSGIIGGSKGRDVAPPRKRKDDTQTYKDANKQLLNKLTSKLGKVSKDVSVTVDFVQNKTTTPHKDPKSPTKIKINPSLAKYKEEFDEEDEELDDLEEYKPVEPVSSENVRRSNRAPKKKSFGDEMIMLDEEDPNDELSDDDVDEEQDEDAKLKDEKPDSDEDDESKHTLKRRRGSQKEEMTTVNVEIVDELPKRNKDEDFKFKKEDEDDDEDEEQASSEDEFVEEDDPERLWCICQRPHNNRFMICCDGCEDWFHGSCVGITKAMGKQMEVEGNEWMCPNCRRATKTEQGCAGGSVVSVGGRRSSPCSYCKSVMRRPDSLFCSDACILAHAATTLRATHEPSQPLSVGEVLEKPTVDQQVKDNPHVLVANNRTGHVLSGKNAPTLNELSDFLKQNPDYSLVRPWEVNARRSSDSSVDKTAQEKQKPGRITINVSKAAAEAGFKDGTPSGASSAPALQRQNYSSSMEKSSIVCVADSHQSPFVHDCFSEKLGNKQISFNGEFFSEPKEENKRDWEEANENFIIMKKFKEKPHKTSSFLAETKIQNSASTTQRNSFKIPKLPKFSGAPFFAGDGHPCNWNGSPLRGRSNKSIPRCLSADSLDQNVQDCNPSIAFNTGSSSAEKNPDQYVNALHKRKVYQEILSPHRLQNSKWSNFERKTMVELARPPVRRLFEREACSPQRPSGSGEGRGFPSGNADLEDYISKLAAVKARVNSDNKIYGDCMVSPYSGQRKTILLTSVKAPPNMTAVAASANIEEPTQKVQRKQKSETPQPKQSKKRSRSESESSKSEAPPTPAPQPTPAPAAPSVSDIRRNVRKALTDSLLRRCEQNRAEFPDYDKNKIEELVKVIEEELFVYFNKSVNFKYKSRYRSLVFNIRDEKNGGLYRQIVTGAVTPQKLATMTSDEMASKELAEWRQTQGKKELEAIQKHELDMLSLGNTYIMKSHKGEIEIDKDDFIRDKEKTRETVMLPEEEPLLEEVTGAKSSSSAASALAPATPDVSKDKSDRHSSSSSSSRHKRSKDRRRDSDRDRERKHSRDDDVESSSRKRSKRDDDDSERKRRRHSGKDDRRDRDRDDRRHRDRDHRDRKRHDSKSDRRDRKSKNDEVSTSDDKVERRNLSSIDEADEEADAQPSSTVGPLPGEPSYDQLLPLPPNLPTYLPHEQEDVIPSTTPPPPSLEDDPSYIAPYSPEAIPPESPIPARNGADRYLLDSPQTPPLEVSPSSTPPPPDDGEYSPSAPPYSGTPLSLKDRKSKPKRSSATKFDSPARSSVDNIAIWRGLVQMTDVAKFSATAFEVSGGSVNFTQDVPESIDIVGRISPDNVWNYIADTKKAASKEILVVRFQPTSEEEKVFYIALYSYLSSKKRYGVVGNCDKTIKDFYIIPLASHQPIPQVLLPLQGPGFEEQRPHMLVGVVVRTKPKRIYDTFSGTWKDLPDTSKLSEESSAMLCELKEASERSFTPPLPGAPYDPEEGEEEQERSTTPDAKKPNASSVLELLPDSPVIATPPGAPDDDDDSDAEIIEIQSNKASKRAKEVEEVVSSNKKIKTDLSKEQESMLAELNRQIEQHKKELNAMHESINQTKEKETQAALREEGGKTESSNVEVESKISDPVKLDTSRISIPDNLHIILEGIKRKEEEIKQKQEEIVRRKNEALGCGGGDTDMRRMLPQPTPFSSTPPTVVQDMKPETNTASAIPKAFSAPIAASLPPPISTMMQVPPTARLGEGVPPPPRPPLHSAIPNFDMPRGPPPGMEAFPPHPLLAPPPRVPGPILSQPLRPPPPRPYLDPHKVPSSPVALAYPPNPGTRSFPPHPAGPPPHNGGHNMAPSSATHPNVPPRGPVGPPPGAPHPGHPPRAPHPGLPPRATHPGLPPRATHPGHLPRGFGPPSSRGGPPPRMVRPPQPYHESDDQYGPQYHPPPHDDFEYGHHPAPGYRPPQRDDQRYREDSYDEYHGYPPDERGRRFSEDRPPLEHEGFDHRRGNRDWNSPRPWKGRGRGDWERRGRGGRW